MNNTAEIVINGTAFQVESLEGNYVLHGPRGARYRTMRNVPNPHLMFLINDRGFTKQAPRVWLSDENGALKVLGPKTS